MAVIATSKPQEDFIVQINGDYNLPFSEETADVVMVSGQVVVYKTGFAIAAKPAAIGDKVRLMVRGNPTTVNAQALTGYVAATHKDALEAKGILVVNE